MSFKYVVIGGFAAVLLSTAAWGQDDTDTYVCNDRLCYDDQAEETRQLNLEQLENGGTVVAPNDYDNADDMQGQGGPYFESEDDANQSGTMSDDDSYGDDDAYADDDDAYVDDDDSAPPADDYDDE